MFYCLNEAYLLRGWEKLGTGIVKPLSGEVCFVNPGLYLKIRDSGWMLFEGSPFMTEEETAAMKECVKAGIFELCERPRPLSERQAYRLYPNRFVRAVQWACTGRCNCRCRHCYMSAPSGHAGDFSHEECMQIIDQMEAAGIQTVSLTGGEALVRKDFREITERLTEAGIQIDVIYSNGILVNEDLLRSLEKMGQRPEFNMSFDGIGRHDWLRGIDGAEEKVLRAFALCKEHGFPTGAEYCLHRENMEVLRESVKLLGSLGCRSLKVNGLSAEGEAQGIREYILTDDEMYQFFLDYIPQFYEDGEPLEIMLSEMFMTNGKKKACVPCAKNFGKKDCGNYCMCAHARNRMYLSPDGYIVPCIPIGSVENGRNRFPRIRDMSLTQALQDSFYMSFIDTRLCQYFKENPECEVCEYRNRCAGGCRGQAAETGSLMSKDLRTCTFFKSGWYEKTGALMKEMGLTV